MTKDTINWNEFLTELTDSILPIYEQHEKTFDVSGIHGRLHIARSILFSEFLARFYVSISDQSNIDFSAIKYAVAFHDSGRKNSGIDFWEKDSEENCYKYLYESGHKLKYSKYTSALISKKVNSSTLRLTRYVQDGVDFENFLYAIRYMSGKLNHIDNPFGAAVKGGRGCWLFASANTEMINNYACDKWWREEIEFMYRNPDTTDSEGWQKILRLDGVWDIPLDVNGLMLYEYGNMESLWDESVTPVPPAP